MTVGLLNRGGIGASLAVAGGVGASIIGGWRDNVAVTLQNRDEGANSTATFAGAGYAVTHPGGVPIVIHVSTYMIFDWRPSGAFTPSRPSTNALLYIDGVAIGVSPYVAAITGFVTSFYSFDQTVLGVGVNYSQDLLVAFTTIVTTPALIAAGVHTYRLDYGWDSTYAPKQDNTVFLGRATETVVVSADVNSALIIVS